MEDFEARIEIQGGSFALDGGSMTIFYIDEHGKHHRLTLNKNMSDRKIKDRYNRVFLNEVLIEKNSEEEKLLKNALMNAKFKKANNIEEKSRQNEGEIGKMMIVGRKIREDIETLNEGQDKLLIEMIKDVVKRLS